MNQVKLLSAVNIISHIHTLYSGTCIKLHWNIVLGCQVWRFILNDFFCWVQKRISIYLKVYFKFTIHGEWGRFLLVSAEFEMKNNKFELFVSIKPVPQQSNWYLINNGEIPSKNWQCRLRKIRVSKGFFSLSWFVKSMANQVSSFIWD